MGGKGIVARILPWAVAVLCALAALLLWGRVQAAHAEAAGLRAWQGAMLRQLTAAGAATTSRGPVAPADASEALARIVAARDGAAAMVAAHGSTRSDIGMPTSPDVATHTEIDRLRETRSTGSAVGDAQIIDADSRAAWRGWK